MSLLANKINGLSLTQCGNADLVICTRIFSAFRHVKSGNYAEKEFQNALLYSKQIKMQSDDQ